MKSPPYGTHLAQTHGLAPAVTVGDGDPEDNLIQYV